MLQLRGVVVHIQACEVYNTYVGLYVYVLGNYNRWRKRVARKQVCADKPEHQTGSNSVSRAIS